MFWPNKERPTVRVEPKLRLGADFVCPTGIRILVLITLACSALIGVAQGVPRSAGQTSILSQTAIQGDTPPATGLPLPVYASQAPAGAEAEPGLAAVQSQPEQTSGAVPVSGEPLTPEQQGDVMMGQQRYQAAIEAYRRDVHRSADGWNKMGIAYQMMFNLVEASRCYQASLKLDAKNPRVMNNLGTIYDTQKNYGDGERLYRKALKQDPKSPLILKNLGTNLLSQHRYKKGWEMYQAALKIDPNIFTSTASPRVQNPTSVTERGAMNFYMAKGCLRAGRNDCAIDYLRMALNEGFTNPKKIEADSEFAGLRGVPAFQQLLAEQRQQ